MLGMKRSEGGRSGGREGGWKGAWPWEELGGLVREPCGSP